MFMLIHGVFVCVLDKGNGVEKIGSSWHMRKGVINMLHIQTFPCFGQMHGNKSMHEMPLIWAI